MYGINLIISAKVTDVSLVDLKKLLALMVTFYQSVHRKRFAYHCP